MDKNTNRPHKGMLQDNNPVDQPKESYRYALNAVNETNDGNRTLLSNEKSNELCWSLPNGYLPIGQVYTVNNEVVIFSTDGIDSEIGIVRDCIYESIVSSSCFNFTVQYQIDAIYRLRNGCERVIYFTDGYNPVRQINLDKLNFYYTDAYRAWLENPIGPWVGEKYNCDLFALIPPYEIPCFSEAQVINGGRLLSGSYNFAIQYLDSDFNPTPWVTVSRPINIYTDSFNLGYLFIDGSSNIENDPLGGTANPSNKAIQLTLTNLDESYTYYRIAAIQATSFNGLVTSVIASDTIPISQTTFIFDGNPSSYTEISVNDIYPSRINLEYAQHIEQLENRLILANTKGKEVNFCGFQKYASKIASHYIVKSVEDTSVTAEGNPKNPLSPFEFVGFMGGEVYAFGIVYVFKDGFESPTYHIPGPPVNKRWDWNTNTCKDVVTDYSVPADNAPIFPWNQDIEHIVPATLAGLYNTGGILPIQRWRVNETAIATSLGVEGQMAFWECSTSMYDKRESCVDGDYWGDDFCGDPLEGTKVRHHRFPSRTLEPHVNNDGGINTFYNIVAKVKLISGVWPNPGFPVDLYTDYDYNTVPQATVINAINESDLDSTTLEYTFIVATESADAPMLITNIVCNLDPLSLCVLYPTDFEVTYTVEFAYQNSYNNSSLKLLGIQFDNVEYPHPDIVGHYFVRAERDDFNRTILDSAIGNKMRESIPGDLKLDYITFSYFTRGNTNASFHNYFFAPKFMYQRQDLSPQYIKSELLFDYNSRTLSGLREDAPGNWVVDVDTLIECRVQNYSGTISAGCGLNHAPEKFMTLNGAAFDDNFTGGRRLYNNSLVNNIQVGKLFRRLPIDPSTSRDLPYVTFRVERDVHCNLDGIKYYKMHNCMIENEGTPRLFAGDVYITQLKLSNTLFREFFDGPEDAVRNALALFAVALSAVLTIVTFGLATPLLVGAIVLFAIGITATAISALVEAMKETDLDETVTDNELDGLFFIGASFVAYANEYIRGVYVESEINTGLRQENNNECGTYYRENRPITEHYRDKIMFFNYDEERWVVKAAPCPEPYYYNIDFSRMTKEKIYFPLLRSYDCCSECLESFPTRVYYSEQSFSEENGDNFRVILSNNYRDIEAEHGSITDLVRKNNSLFILTEECLWYLPQNVQQSVVSDIVTFLGTGSYFSIPPRKVVDSDMGSAGTRHKWSVVKTPIGIVYISEIEKAVYITAGEGLQKISNQGMYNWFFENVESYLGNQFLQLTGQEFPYLNNPNNPNAVGIHSVYDPRHQRILITKRDYKLLPPYSDSITIVTDPLFTGYVEDQIYYIEFLELFAVGNDGGGATPILFTNEEYFENKSFTISFSLLSNTWVSFHSYLPLFYYSDQHNFYSSIGTTNLYKHNIIGNHQKFYGTDYPYILETVSVSNPLTTRLWEDITLETYARTWDATNKDYYDVRWKTFNYVTLYNSRQTTGELEMIVKDTQADPEDYYEQQTTNSNTSIVVDRKERDWHINDFRDMRIDYTIPMFTKDWTALAPEYPIDKVINPAAIDIDKDWYDQESFRDKYLIIRLRFANFEEVELTTNFVIETEQQSFR